MAVPLACLLLTLAAGVHAVLPASSAALTGSVSVHEARMIEAGDMRRTVDVGWRLQGILEPQSSLRIQDDTHVSLVAGEAILSVPGYSVFLLDSVRSLILLDATVWVRRDGDVWSVVPLDAPVLLKTSHAVSILSVGSQYHLGSAERQSPVPLDWMLQKTADAASLAAQEIQTEADSPSFQDDPFVLAVFFRTYTPLSDDGIRDLLSLGRRLDQSGVLSGLIALRLGLDPGRIGGEEGSPALRNACRLSPLADTGIGALPDIVRSHPMPVAAWLIDVWSESLMRRGMDDPVSGVSMFREHRDLPVLLKEAGYPLQSEKWQAVLLRAEQVLSPLLTPDQRTSLDAKRMPDQEIHPLQSSSSAPASPRFTEKQLFTVTRQMLADHGALMGSATHLFPLAGPPQAVRVVGIFIAEDGRDIPYEFIFDPAAHVLSRIIRDGMEQPNAVPVEVFFKQ